MDKLTTSDLHSLEDYSRMRDDFRARVLAHKAHRRVPVGQHVTLIFEDRLTILYQVQEMLRVERLCEEAELRDELDAYNPLIPDGGNWKATMMIEYADANERREALARLIGIEHHVWVRVDGRPAVTGIADEDLERATADKTSAVHFLRFEVEPSMISALRDGAGLEIGIGHPACQETVEVPETVRESLIADLR